MKARVFILLLGIALILSLFFALTNYKSPQPSVNEPQITLTPTAYMPSNLGVRTKISGCVINGPLPDSECTPGAIFPDVTKDQVCTPGYSKSIRNVTESTKNEVFLEYGVTTRELGEYEVDHLISLELGGSNDISNLWPEPAEPRPGFHEKDKVENFLHSQVCSGAISLSNAQKEISTNWLEVYKNLP